MFCVCMCAEFDGCKSCSDYELASFQIRDLDTLFELHRIVSRCNFANPILGSESFIKEGRSGATATLVNNFRVTSLKCHRLQSVEYENEFQSLSLRKWE